MNKELLIETRQFKPSPVRLVEGLNRGGNIFVEGILATVEVKNGNGRYYKKELWEREISNFQKKIDQKSTETCGELDHPDSSVINLNNVNNNEKLSHMVTRFDSGIGYYNSRLDYFFRDWRENKSISMDSEVLKNLFSICEQVLGQKGSINVQITSGYRTKKTNEKLRVRSKNVAKNSLHIEGKAIDFAIREVSQKKLRSAAKDICSGGLGFYPGFIHIDSGPVRRWGI